MEQDEDAGGRDIRPEDQSQYLVAVRPQSRRKHRRLRPAERRIRCPPRHPMAPADQQRRRIHMNTSATAPGPWAPFRRSYLPTPTYIGAMPAPSCPSRGACNKRVLRGRYLHMQLDHGARQFLQSRDRSLRRSAAERYGPAADDSRLVGAPLPRRLAECGARCTLFHRRHQR